MSIVYDTYSPPPPPKGTIDIRIGVFFDGTQNNRTNTNASKGLEGVKGNKAYNSKSDKETDSYVNDLSNVARKELHYTKSEFVDSVYIEGIGTEDFEEDSDNKLDHKGVAFGSGDKGIIAKVRKGCELVADKVAILGKELKINSITLDVIGFSRGSAAARNFVYELSKSKYQALNGTKTTGRAVVKIKVDSHGYETNLKEFPKNGHLGLKLKDTQYARIDIRFIGLYDTVSSYDPNATNTTKNPDYNNDVEELHLNTINIEVNNLYKAKNIIHFCASDEHRKNFMLTPTKKAGGKDFYLPGVHSDVGGCYTDKMDEKHIQIMDLDNYWGDGYDDEEYDVILNNDLNDLIKQGWFNRSEVVAPDSDHQTHINRKGIRNTYSLVTLHLMVEILNKKYIGTINMNKLNEFFGIPKPSIPNELDLYEVKQRLLDYIDGKQPQMKYYTSEEIEHFRKRLDLKNPKDVASFNLKVKDHNMLVKLRKNYIHWNSKFGDGIGAYEPNYKILNKTIVRTRLIEPNS